MKCLRCGRDASQESSFCETCAEAVKEPLRESSYLHTQIVLPTRKPQPIVKKAEPKKERKRRPWKLIVATALLSLLCAALLLQGVFYAYRSLQLRAELESVQSSAEKTQEAVDFLDEHLVFVQEHDLKHYHHYDCPLFTRQGYRAYTPERAQIMRYEPCHVCQ